jgi:thioredoxin 1
MNAIWNAGVLLLLLLGIAGCGKKGPAVSAEKPMAQRTASELAAGAQATFVELGSVNCIPCRMMQPVMKEIETAYSGRIKVVFIDVMTEKGRPYAQQFGIRAIPTQVFLDSTGKELARHIGFYPRDSIVALLADKGVK